MKQPDREFQIFAKPVGPSCNLNCSYCYYHNTVILNQDTAFSIIKNEILEKYIIQHLETTTSPIAFFSWHGGEPTLAGIDFFKKILELQKKHQPSGMQIINGIQTNGLNLNDNWCSFLSDAHFMVGISMDGPEQLHDKYRISKSGSGSFQKVMKGYELLRKFNIQNEVLCVINALNVNYSLELYHFFKSIDVKNITFLPLVEKDFTSGSGVTSSSVNSKAFGDFIIKIFDEWLDKDIGAIKIQILEEAFRAAFKQDHTLCIFRKTCGGVPVLERNGDLYSCDHFVSPLHLLGNINDFHLSEMLDGQKQKAFGQAKFNSLPNYCLKCNVLEMCYGECPKNRFIKSPDNEDGLNYLCEGYYCFFNHCKDFIQAIASVWKNQF